MNYDVGNRSIEAKAELGGLEKMRNFLIGLPLLLGVLFLILFGILFQEKRGGFRPRCVVVGVTSQRTSHVYQRHSLR